MTPDTASALQLTESGLPPHIHVVDPKKPSYLPLHFVTWCLIEDTSGSDPQYAAFDALSFYADGSAKLSKLGCDTTKAQRSFQEAHRIIVELSLRNRQVVANLYNEYLLPLIVDKLMAFDTATPGVINHAHIPTGETLESYLTKQLTCREQNQRVYTNIGHSTRNEQAEYDTNRGPATIETIHSYTRYLLIDRLSMLVGQDPNAKLDTEEYGRFLQLINAVASIIPGIGDREILSQKSLASMGANELSKFVKMLDPYSDYLATFSMPILSTMVSHVLGSEDLSGLVISVDQRAHMAAATSLVADHGQSLMIKVRPDDSANIKQYAQMDDVEFGTNLMSKVFPELQQFMHDYYRAHKAIFDEAIKHKLSKEEIANLLTTHLSAYENSLSPGALGNLAQALIQLRPTAKMEDAQAKGNKTGDEYVEPDGNTRRTHILVNDLVIGIIQLFINHKSYQTAIQGLIQEKKLTVDSLRIFLHENNLNPSTTFASEDPKYGQRSQEIWERAFYELQTYCFTSEQDNRSLEEKMVQQLLIATLGLERRGVRVSKGGRPENIPRIPGLLLSYRVRQNTEGVRELEIELGIAVGQAASVEKVTGISVNRIADVDQPK